MKRKSEFAVFRLLASANRICLSSEAVETRHALHGVTWPSSNPKCLNVDFGKEEDMEKAIVSTLEEPRIQITTENRDVKEEKEFGWSKDPYKNSSVDDRSRVSCTIL